MSTEMKFVDTNVLGDGRGQPDRSVGGKALTGWMANGDPSIDDAMV